MTRNNVLMLTIILILPFLSYSCKDIGPQVSNKSLTLTIADASCTEVWLKLQLGAGFTGCTVTFERDSVTLWTRTIDVGETAITDTNLLPHHTYTYYAQLSNGSFAQEQATTMDTTNNDFTWTSQTLGDGTGSSMLYDVAIINDTVIYACGAIYSGGSICNLARWNGQHWDTMHVSVTLTYTSSQIVTDQDPLKTVYAFNENDVWVVSSSGGVSHWNGTLWTMLSIPFNQGPGACIKMWGTSSSDLYFVGSNGRIIHYNGSSWTKIESGTTLDVYDIYGSGNEILTVASNIGSSFDRKILKIDGTAASSISDSPIAYSLESVWFVPSRGYYVVGDGIFEKHSLLDTDWKNISQDIFTTIRGSATNDIFAAGIGGRIMHFNGVTWMNYRDQTGLPTCIYGSVAMKENLIVAVGNDGSKACIVMGKR